MTKPLLKILGIPLRIHSSLILLIIYLVFATALQFPLLTEEAGVNPALLRLKAVPWAILLPFSLLFSVLVHELGHALIARSLGLEVRSITLMMLGGIASIERTPEKPSSEIRLAIAGPVVSLLIFATTFLAERTTQSPDLILFFHWMSRTNLVLAIFNLLPAFPLDGGRILRAFLAMRQGQLRATQTSVKISHVFAILLGIIGFLSFNLFLLLVAFFIYAGAQAEGQMTISKTRLRGLLAGALTHRVFPRRDTDSIAEAAMQMRETGEPIIPILSSDKQPALLTIDQILGTPKERRTQTQISEVIQPGATFVNYNEPVSQFFESIATAPEGALPVLKDNELIGIIRYSDVLTAAGISSIDEETLERPPTGRAA